MRFCECNAGKYRWRDVARINDEYYKVDEDVFFVEENGKADAIFDIDPIEKKLAEKYNVDSDDIELATFVKPTFPENIIRELWGDKELGGYCAVCGGDV